MMDLVVLNSLKLYVRCVILREVALVYKLHGFDSFAINISKLIHCDLINQFIISLRGGGLLLIFTKFVDTL